MTNIAQYLQSQGELIEQQLDKLIPVHHGPYGHLYEAARYSLLGGGKRLRPIFTLTTTRMFGGNPETALSPACALEMIHTYSLIHDDLPCMDDDDYRRGKLTVHKKYSEGHAVLTGDFLLTYAFEVLATDAKLSHEKRSQLIATLARQSGSHGMIGGQVMDLYFEGKKIPLETLKMLHRNKTAALLTASIELGGIIADATPAHLDCLRHFGENIGLAFQVVDDILDVTSSQAKHGKCISSDVRNEKTTYVTLLGLDQAHEYAQRYYNQALNSIKPLPFDTTLLISLADFILHRKY